jgi:hypothetical protein
MRVSLMRVLIVAACLMGQVLWSMLPQGASLCLRGLAPCGAMPAVDDDCGGCCCEQADPACPDEGPLGTPAPVCPAGCDCCISVPATDQVARAAERLTAIDDLAFARIHVLLPRWEPTPRVAMTGLPPHERPPPAACSTLRTVRLTI